MHGDMTARYEQDLADQQLEDLAEAISQVMDSASRFENATAPSFLPFPLFPLLRVRVYYTRMQCLCSCTMRTTFTQCGAGSIF